jgi:curved DNA-binding protein CbpA
MEFEDYYQALGVGADSSANDIKEAYKYKANVLHPDRLMGVSESIRSRAEEDLKKVNRAYDVLGNPTRRKKYHADW